MPIFAVLSGIFNTAFSLFCFALGIWAGYNAMRGQGLSGQYWGAIWTCAGMAVVGLVFWLARAVSGEQLRWVYVWYELYFVIVFPGTFALLRGRDDRVAALIFAGVAIFSGLAALSAADPSRHVIAPLITVTPTPIG